MRNLRFNIASILGVILFIAVGFAALRQADDLWDSGLFTLTLGLLLVSILLAVHRSKTRRAFWIGFALFGWGYLGLSLVPSSESRLITTKALAYLDSKVSEESWHVTKHTVVLPWSQPGASNNQAQSVAFTKVFYRQAKLWVGDDASGRLLGSWGGTTENRIRIGHSLFALLAGLVGGVLSRRLSRVSAGPEVCRDEGAT